VAQALQLVGAVAILAAFALAQLGRLSQDAPAYLWLNVAGSALLAGLALAASQWGFLLLEGCWALISAWGLIRTMR
jgi:hypothetical protein